MGYSTKTASFLVESRLAAAVRGEIEAFFDLGMAYSTGASGVDVDLVEAHKWFNLAALGGNHHAQECRAEIADEMSAREIAQAQRQARAWMMVSAAQAA